MKKLLLLGGLKYLIPVIKKAQNLGYYVITCDYLPHNIAHKYSDEYHNISIIDKEAVFTLAQKLKVNGVMSFAVDPGVVTSAYVCEKMGLPSPGPYESVKILQNKALFRKFLKDNGFLVPKFECFTSEISAIQNYDYQFPAVVKPVDSAGSKGVSKVENEKDLPNAIELAFKESRSGKIIIEEFIESQGYPSDSDSFSVNGSSNFITFSNQRFDINAPNPYTPTGFTWPSSMSVDAQEYFKAELKRLIKLLGMNSSLYNIETRISQDGLPYIMEVAPRGGGNRIAEMIEISTGVDLISHCIKAAMGEKVEELTKPVYRNFVGQFILHSNKRGRFKGIRVNPDIRNNVIEIDLWTKPNEIVNAFHAANNSIGTVVLKFSNEEELNQVIDNYSTYIKVDIEE